MSCFVRYYYTFRKKYISISFKKKKIYLNKKEMKTDGDQDSSARWTSCSEERIEGSEGEAARAV